MTEPTLPPEPAKDATADELEADIAATRQQLGETIDALEDKLDVSAQTKRKVDQTKTEIADKVNATKAQVTNKVHSVRTHVTDKARHAKAQVTGKVAHTKAKVTSTDDGATNKPVTDTMYPAEGQVTDSSAGSREATFTGKATFTDKASQTKADVTDQVKNITRLASKVTEARARTRATGNNAACAKRAGNADGVDPAPAGATDTTDSTPAASTTAFTDKIGQTKANLTHKASQYTARTRQNPRSVLPAAGAALAAVTVTSLAWRVAKNRIRR